MGTIFFQLQKIFHEHNGEIVRMTKKVKEVSVVSWYGTSKREGIKKIEKFGLSRISS